jgi:2-phospho-L-lactate/phosphoenolpyruvate guanylyltransferase
MTPFTWSVVIPVKVLAKAKSRLGRVAGEHRAELALAMAADTVTAVLACERVEHVMVITDDQVAGTELASLGAIVVPDEPRDGLNAALRHGASVASARWPASGVAALQADLPALRPADLTQALTAAAAFGSAFVADQAGEGTTMYTAAPGTEFQPGFGSGSRARHAAGGATDLAATNPALADLDGLRQDVDTPEDLCTAASLGLGKRTAPIAAGLLRCAPPGR